MKDVHEEGIRKRRLGGVEARKGLGGISSDER